MAHLHGGQDQAREEAKREIQEINATLVRDEGPVGGLTAFNIEYGFLEAVLRGLKSGFLKPTEYRQLCQCENFEDVKLALSDTDYATALAAVQKLTPEVILNKCQQKFVAEFEWVRSQAVGSLSTFLEMITYEYMIQNVSFIISSLIRGADPATLLSKCLPLGRSPHLKNTLIFDNTEGADGLLDLYRVVLVEMPIARYFETYFQEELGEKRDYADAPAQAIQAVYTEVEIDIITNRLQKLWLEDFHRYCLKLGGETAEKMNELLSFEADRRAIAITINSFGSSLNEPQARDHDRKELYCSFGTLYPEATMFQFTKVGDMASLQAALQPYAVFREIFAKAAEHNRSVTDELYTYEVGLMERAFDGQSHFAAYYAWTKLKKQEERNLKWILSCINQRRSEKEKNMWIPIFDPTKFR